MEMFLKEKAEMDNSHRIAENLRAERKGGNCILTIMAVIAVISICLFGIAFSKKGQVSITVDETGMKVEKVIEIGAKKKNVATLTVLNDEVVVKGDNCGASVSVGQGCHITLCNKHGEIECYNIKLKSTLEDLVKFRDMACFSHREQMICNIYDGTSMLYFTVDECGTICGVLSKVDIE
jgi:hypothetical protein